MHSVWNHLLIMDVSLLKIMTDTYDLGNGSKIIYPILNFLVHTFINVLNFL